MHNWQNNSGYRGPFAQIVAELQREEAALASDPRFKHARKLVAAGRVLVQGHKKHFCFCRDSKDNQQSGARLS